MRSSHYFCTCHCLNITRKSRTGPGWGLAGASSLGCTTARLLTGLWIPSLHDTTWSHSSETSISHAWNSPWLSLAYRKRGQLLVRCEALHGLMPPNCSSACLHPLPHTSPALESQQTCQAQLSSVSLHTLYPLPRMSPQLHSSLSICQTQAQFTLLQIQPSSVSFLSGAQTWDKFQLPCI